MGIFHLQTKNASLAKCELHTFDKSTMKTAILASLLASAAAFAPVQQATKSTALNAFEEELGAQPP